MFYCVYIFNEHKICFYICVKYNGIFRQGRTCKLNLRPSHCSRCIKHNILHTYLNRTSASVSISGAMLGFFYTQKERKYTYGTLWQWQWKRQYMYLCIDLFST